MNPEHFPGYAQHYEESFTFIKEKRIYYFTGKSKLCEFDKEKWGILYQLFSILFSKYGADSR